MKKLMMVAVALLGMAMPAMAQGTGCGVGALAGYSMGQIGNPVGIGATGQKLGVIGSCDLKLGTYMVVGAFTSYEWVFGDQKTVGIKDEWVLGGRAGVLLTPTTLVYGHAGWSRVGTDLVGNVDGWKLGPGIEVALPSSPMTLDLRASYGLYDKISGVPGFDARTTEVRVGLNYKFGSSGWAPTLK